MSRSIRPHHNKLRDFNEGRVPHMNVHIGGHTFDAPVAVDRWFDPEWDSHGKHLHALPGGGRVDSDGKVIRWGKRHVAKDY